MKKQRSASPSQAIPRSAFSCTTRCMISRRFASSSGSGGWLGKVPSSSKYILTASMGRRGKIAPAPTAPMPLPVSITTLSGGTAARSMKDRQCSA